MRHVEKPSRQRKPGRTTSGFEAGISGPWNAPRWSHYILGLPATARIELRAGTTVKSLSKSDIYPHCD